MTWNKRIIRRDHPMGVTFSIHEVFYDNEGEIDGWTAEPVGLDGNDLDDLKLDFFLTANAFLKPVLVEVGDTLVEYKPE